MADFPRTTVGGVSLPRLLIGTNWFLGYSHTSRAKDLLIQQTMPPERIADVIAVFLENGIDAIMAPPRPVLKEALDRVRDRTGRDVIQILTPHFNIKPGGPAELEPERQFDECKAWGATFCLPHQGVTDALVDKRERRIRDLERYTAMIRERDMIPGLSTHMPETVVYADQTEADVETYIQIYNAAGFLMHLEADWVMRIIRNAKKPVMTIKPLAAGRLLPPVGLAFVWNTIREQDMVTVGVSSPDEALEVIELSQDLLSRRIPDIALQTTRSKASVM